MGVIVAKISQSSASPDLETAPLSPTANEAHASVSSLAATSSPELSGHGEEERTSIPNSAPSPLPQVTESLEECSTEEERSTSAASRGAMVEKCLKTLETGFELKFEREQLLRSVQEILCSPGETLIAAGQEAAGVYVVEEGGLDIFSPDRGVLLNSVGVGEFCGELSSFFRIPCSATVRTHRSSRTTVLLLPLSSLSVSSHVERVPMHRLLQWCAVRSYVSTGTLFDRAKAAILTKTQILNNLKVTFPTWSSEAINYIASKSRPLLFHGGDILYEAGEELSFALLILRGSVEMSSESNGMNQVRIDSSCTGFCIGRKVLNGSSITETVKALSPVLAVPITQDLLKDTLNQFPSDSCNHLEH